MTSAAEVRAVGNYRIYDPIGSGGMGSVHLGRLFAPGGFRRLVAIKRLHPHLLQDTAFVTALLDEARLASRIHHPNVIATLDVVSEGGEVFLILEYVPGVSLAALAHRSLERNEPVPLRIAIRIIVDVLNGLHAAHEAKGDDGMPLDLVHRDVSPQNILIGRDGSARLLDFGVAKAAGRSQTTDEGTVKGKRSYMAPEHLLGQTSRASDLYSTAVVLVELLSLERLFPDEKSIPDRISGKPVRLPDPVTSLLSPGLQASMLRALAPDPTARFQTAREMSIAFEATDLATSREVSEWLERIAAGELLAGARLVERAESMTEPPPSVHSGESILTSEIAIAESASSFQPKRPRTGLVILGAFALSLVVAVVLFLMRPHKEERVIVVSSATPSTAVASSAPSDSVTVAPPPSSAPVLEHRRDQPPIKGQRLAPRPHHAKGASSACKPYVLDSNGRTVFNEGCLQ